MADYIRVTALNALAKQWLAQCDPLNNLIVLGEISNFTRHYKSGHLYFTLKDEAASVKAVMFRDKARLLGFPPQNGMLVLAYGRATLYERDGAFQLYIDFMRPFGAGAAQMAFDALKKAVDSAELKPSTPEPSEPDGQPVATPAPDEHPDIAEGIANGTWGGKPTATPGSGSTSSTTNNGASNTVPQTSDDFPYMALIVLACVAAGGVGVVLYAKKRKSDR